MTDARAKRPPPGPPPTIGYLLVQGITHFRVSCNGSNCHHGADMKLDALGLPDDTPFPRSRPGAGRDASAADFGRFVSCRVGHIDDRPKEVLLMRLSLAFVALLIGPPALSAPVEHTLPPSKEAAWIAAVKGLKTSDGSTVLQTLQSAEKLRPTKFKVGSFNGAYQGGTGNPIGVGIDYWIGLRRKNDDAFTVFFNVKEENGKPIVSYKDGSPAKTVMSGQEGLLTYIDDEYRNNCIDIDNGAKLC